MTRETKAGLLMIVMLGTVFGFMVYKRIHHPTTAMAQQPLNVPDSRDGDAAEPAITPDDRETFAARPAPVAEDSTRGVTVADTGERDPFADPAPAATSRRETSTKKIPLEVPTARTVQTAAAEEADPFAEPTRTTPVPVRDVATPDRSADAAPGLEPTEALEPARPATRSNIAAASEPSAPVVDDFGGANDPFGAGATSQPVPVSEPSAVTESFEAPSRARINQPESSPTSPPNETELALPDDLPPRDLAPSRALPAEEFPTETPGFPEEPATPVAPAPSPRRFAELQQSNDPFDQPPAESQPAAAAQSPEPTAVPTLKIPSRDSLPVEAGTEDNDKFGGFRPSDPRAGGGFNAEPAPTAEFGAPEPVPARAPVTTPHPSAEPRPAAAPRRAPRPAPVTSIDEDFNTRAAPRPLVAGDTYQIEPNDNYWTISRKKYGTGRYFMALAQHNARIIADPRRMKPGVTISTPPAAALDQHYAEVIPKAATVDPVRTASVAGGPGFSGTGLTPVARTAPDGGEQDAGFFIGADGAPMYRVGAEDTLSGIAQRHLGRSSRWVQVFEMNRDVLTDGNTLKIGAVLRLPADASQVEVVRNPRVLR